MMRFLSAGRGGYGFHRANSVSSWSPLSWLFSGWNWVAKTLPRRIAAVNRPPVLARAGHVGGVVADQVKAVHEVEDELPLAERRDERMIDFAADLVPAHVRHLEAARAPVEPDHAGVEPPEPLVRAVLGAVPGEQLHAEADAEKRLPLLDHLALEHVHQAARVEVRHRVAERADTRENDALRRVYFTGIRGHHRLLAEVLEGVVDRPDVPHPVIDDRDHM